ncbi:hypothetical protein, partial [Planktothricoides raciborskii]
DLHVACRKHIVLLSESSDRLILNALYIASLRKSCFSWFLVLSAIALFLGVKKPGFLIKLLVGGQRFSQKPGFFFPIKN